MRWALFLAPLEILWAFVMAAPIGMAQLLPVSARAAQFPRGELALTWATTR
jgi:hypothetical protein